MYTITGTTIRLTRGDTFVAEIGIYNADGTEYTPAAGDTITFAMSKTYFDAPVLEKDVNSLVLALTQSDTSTLPFGRYVYSISVERADGAKDTFIAGSLILDA